MNPLNMESLARYRESSSGPAVCRIRVGMDTGGIAAGAREVLEALEAAREEAAFTVEIQQTGSPGYAFADPLVMVSRPGLPDLTLGGMDPASARHLMAALSGNGSLPEDRILASRDHAHSLNGGAQQAILVRDTSEEAGDKTAFFQQCIFDELAVHGLAGQVQVHRALDMGVYHQGVCLQLYPSGVTYANVLTPDVRRVIQETLQNGRVLEDLLVQDTTPQERIVLRNCGTIDPDSLESYLRAGGYAGLQAVLETGQPELSIEQLKESGLRGRGGAGFPTWKKWQLTRRVEADQRYVICNADEGDPGAFMDRSVLEGDPHAVLEGLIIAAYCIGAGKGYFYIRAEYPLAVQRVQQAIEAAREYGLLGKTILGTDFAFDVEVRLGAGAFVCGEETALIASIEGRRGSPIPRPPYPSVSGLWGKPTAINNVETLAAVSAIFAHGAEWYTRHGTPESPGTKVFAVTGKVRNSQLVEVPMGLPIRTIIEDMCGGVLDNEELKAVQTGGPSGGVIPEKLLDTPVSYESLQALGSIMGSGGMLVMDRYDCMVDVAKFYLKFCVDESCGKCAPCRVGGFQMLQILEKIHRGRGEEGDLERLEQISTAMRHASLCGLGQTAPNPVLSTLKYFRNEYRAYIEGGTAYARKRKKQAAELARKAG